MNQIFQIALISLSSIFFASAVVAESNDSILCNKLIKLSDIHRIHPHDDRVKNFMLGWTTTKEGDDFYPGLDIDGDGKKDYVTRSCGSGAGMLCTLSIKLSSGKTIVSDEVGPFYLGQLYKTVYMIETIDGKISPYTTTSTIKISALTRDGLQLVCNKNHPLQKKYSNKN